MFFRNTIHYIETRGPLGQGSPENDNRKSQLYCYINQQFHYKASHGKASINYVDKINMILTLWVGPFLTN